MEVELPMMADRDFNGKFSGERQTSTSRQSNECDYVAFDDKNIMASLGYKQDLKRSLGLLMLF